MSRFYSRPGLLAVWMFQVPKDSGPVYGWGAADCHSLVGGGGRPGHKCRFFAGLMLGSVRGREGGSATHPRGCDSFCFEYTVGVVSEPPINEILGRFNAPASAQLEIGVSRSVDSGKCGIVVPSTWKAQTYRERRKAGQKGPVGDLSPSLSRE